jgi:hypothetical protein
MPDLEIYRVLFRWKGGRYHKYRDILKKRAYLKGENMKTAYVKVISITWVYLKEQN